LKNQNLIQDSFERHEDLNQIFEPFKRGKNAKNIKPKDVVLYGFGRIGRLLAREMMSKIGKGQQLRLRAIVTRDRNDANSLEKRASLLRYDSVHGDFEGSVQADVENNALIINGTTVHIITANTPEEIDYTKYGIEDALVIDNTGAFTTEEALKRHLVSKGVNKVLLTAPGKGVPNIVYGVNHNDYNPDKVDIYSAASCTTNAITPILQVVEEALGVLGTPGTVVINFDSEGKDTSEVPLELIVIDEYVTELSNRIV
jgi:glyceraldehyde 3-phosphate dehydrogenase